MYALGSTRASPAKARVSSRRIWMYRFWGMLDLQIFWVVHVQFMAGHWSIYASSLWTGPIAPQQPLATAYSLKDRTSVRQAKPCEGLSE